MAYGAYSKGGYTLGANEQQPAEPQSNSRFTSMFEKALADLVKKQTTPKDQSQIDAGGKFMFGPHMRAGE